DGEQLLPGYGVSGQELLAVPEVEPRLEVVVVVPRRLVIGPDRDAERPVRPRVQAHRYRQPRRVAVRCENEACTKVPLCRFWPFGRAPATVCGRRGCLPRRDAGDLAGPFVDGQAGDRDVLDQANAGLLCVPGQELVEVSAGPDRSVAGERGKVGPSELDPAAAADEIGRASCRERG